jgi:hypothetical protein
MLAFGTISSGQRDLNRHTVYDEKIQEGEKGNKGHSKKYHEGGNAVCWNEYAPG